MARTTPLPMCWATSSAICCVSPWMSLTSVSMKLISGSEPTGNSTSTTGPMTCTTRPGESSPSPIAAPGMRVSVISGS
jgi:hypothetical protein